jgi:PAS domain S-box-containing protein
MESLTRKEEELIRKNTQLEHLISSSPAVLFSAKIGPKIQENFKFTFISDNVEELTGYTASELIADPMFFPNKFHPEDINRLNQLMDTILDNETIHIDYRFRHKDGSYHWHRNEIRFICDSNNIPIEMLGSIIDISDQIYSHQLRQELSQQRDSFISMVNHELRTPLSVLMGYLEFLAKSPEISEINKMRIYQTMTKNVKRLERLIIDSQTFTQVDRGIFSVELQAFEFKVLFQEIKTEYEARHEGDIEFQEEGIEGVEIAADYERIKQVFDNLLDNAVKQTPPRNREIKVKAKIEGENLVIDITDNGAGIKRSNLDQIFNQFVTIKTEYSAKGTGIGLYLAREIVRAHKGTIKAESPGEGQGSTFTITFPLKK